MDEVPASSITTLDALNQAFAAWRELKYNRRSHTETGQAPWERWRAGAQHVVHVDERRLVEAFLFRTSRTTDKAGVLSLFGVRYQVGPELARKKVEVRYDPERMESIEVWHGERFEERVKPLEVLPDRRPVKDTTVPAPSGAPTVDWLGHLTAQHTPVPVVDAIEIALREREQLDAAVLDVLRSRLSPETFDENEALEFLGRYGPLQPGHVQEVVELVVEMGGTDQHIHVVLRALRESLGGER